MPRGGQRKGAPGKAYPNRTDMHQPPRAPSGGEYGSMKQSIDSQKVIPLPTANSAPVQQAVPSMAPTLAPGDLAFDAPSDRPSEPVTAGLAVGAGPGPEVLGLPSEASQVAMQLRAMYANIPEARNGDFLRLVELAEQQAWT